MAEARNGGITLVYRAGVIVLFAILCFIGARIYNTIDLLPKEYVTMERYKCDIDRLDKTMQTGFSEIKAEIRSIKP